MRSRVLRVVVMLMALIVVTPTTAWSLETQPGSACTVANSFLHTGGPENPGAGLLLVCDGSTWLRVIEWDTNGNLGIKKAAPKAPLHVGGEAIIGSTTGLACDTDRQGGIRYNSVSTKMEFCNGSTWELVGIGVPVPPAGADAQIQFNSNGSLAASSSLVFSSANRLGVLTLSPAAPLHVSGEAIVGNTGLVCDAARAGGLRWSSVNSTIEMCNGVAWQKIVASAGGMDCTPNAFAFTDVIDQPLSTTITSNLLTITGIDPGCAVSVTGSGSPRVSINGGAWVNSVLINPGDSLQVRQISSGSPSTARVAAVAPRTRSQDGYGQRAGDADACPWRTRCGTSTLHRRRADTG